jgi:hypothetical protein
MTAAAQALGAVLPDRRQTLLLRACLRGGEDAAAAWAAWRAGGGDLRSALGADRGPKHLAALLHQGLRSAGVEADRNTLTVLRTAAVREELRAATLDRIAADALTALREAGTEVLVARGAALAAGAYPGPGLRHCHDLDLLVDPRLRDRAAGAVVAAGVVSAERRDSHTTVLTHQTGVELRLHSRLFPIPWYDDELAGVLRRGVPVTVGGVAARMPGPADMLLHVCVHAVCCARPWQLSWAPDAWFTLRRWPELDWGQLLATARITRVQLPLQVTLSWLARELGAPVPQAVLGELAADGARASAGDRDVALALAWAARRRGGGGSTARRTRRGALAFARWALLPSPAYLRATGRVRHRALLPAAYLARPLRLALRTLSGTTSWPRG